MKQNKDQKHTCGQIQDASTEKGQLTSFCRQTVFLKMAAEIKKILN